jgi:hypothetical protein
MQVLHRPSEPARLTVCFHFTSFGHPLGDSSDFVFFGEPLWSHGGYAATRICVHFYEIPTTVDGTGATEIRMMVYASGCGVQQFVIPLAENSRTNQEFQCVSALEVRFDFSDRKTSAPCTNSLKLPYSPPAPLLVLAGRRARIPLIARQNTCDLLRGCR